MQKTNKSKVEEQDRQEKSLPGVMMIRILSAQLILLTAESIPISEGFDSEHASALETLSRPETAVNWGQMSC